MSNSSVPVVSDLLSLTAQIVSAHVASNPVAAEALPDLISRVHGALASVGMEPAPTSEAAPQQQPAVPVKKSVQPDYLVCLEDGAKVTMLKRYLQRRFGLTPDQYRAKWGLAGDYPMVAPSYAARRSTLAKELGLGRKRPAPEGIAPAVDEAGTAVKGAAAKEQMFAADAADEVRAGRHTAESVFANFGRDGSPQTDGDGEQDTPSPTPAAAAPAKRGRKPFAEQSVRNIRSRRTAAEG